MGQVIHGQWIQPLGIIDQDMTIEEVKGPYLSRRRAGDLQLLKVAGHRQEDLMGRADQVGMGMIDMIEEGNMGMEVVDKVLALPDLEIHIRLVEGIWIMGIGGIFK